MSSQFSYARILAETAAWAFWAPCAFGEGITRLSRVPGGALDGPTSSLACELESHLRLRADGASLDTLRQVRDLVWFGTETPDLERPLSDVLYDLGRSYFTSCGNEKLELRRTGPNAEVTSHELVHRLRYLTLALPLDLLAASIGGERPGPELLFPSNDISTKAFEELLNDGIVEIHSHLTACLRFEALWTYLMTTTGSPKIRQDDLDEQDIPFESCGAFMSWLATAGLARLTMAEYLSLHSRRSANIYQSFYAFVESSLRGELDSRRKHRGALAALAVGGAPSSGSLVRALYSQYVDAPTMVERLASLKELRERDPLCEMLTVNAATTWPECHFIRQALHYLRIEGRADYAFAQIFWQYQRIRCMTYRYLTQEPGTAGLDWFVRFFRRLSPLRVGLDDRVLMDSALEIHHGQPSPGGGRPSWLRTLEVRIGPRDRWNKVRDSLHAVVPSSDNGPSRVKLGVIIHFQKAGLDTTKTIARPGGRSGNGLIFTRYGDYYRNWDREATAIKRALKQDPSLLQRLRGLDICGQELSTPLWPLLPLLGDVRQVSRDLSAEATGKPDPSYPSLRITLHAGEDFRTPLEGLRRIHEPIEFHLLEPNDRIGHAIALGVDISEWAKSRPRAWQPREERLDDLLWLLDRESELKLLRRPELKKYVADKACELAKEIYEDDALSRMDQPDLLMILRLARRLRHAPEFVRDWKYPTLEHRPRSPSPVEKLLLRYLTDLGVFYRGSTPVEVSMSEAETALVEQAQRFLSGLIASVHLTIEANPSSNLLIAGLDELDRHPVFRICPLPPEGLWQQVVHRAQRLGRKVYTALLSSACESQLRVALCTDDPLTFATSLPEELAYIYHALRRQGYSEKNAIRWLKDRQEDAKDGIFAVMPAPSGMGR